MATATKTRVTADEFLKMDLGEGLFELVRGEIFEMPPPGIKHGLICSNIVLLLHGFGLRTGHGYAPGNDASVRISADTVRGADVSYYSEARWPRSRAGPGPAPVPPDLAVEVRSPSDSSAMLMEKVADYLKAGVLMIWTVDPEARKVTIYRRDVATPSVLAESDMIENLPELPGFRASVADFFA